jgi:MFS family permease
MATLLNYNNYSLTTKIVYNALQFELQRPLMKQNDKYLAWVNWGVSTAFVLFQFFLQTAAGLMTSPWMHEFHLTRIGVSNLSAAFFYTYLLMQVPVGLFYDRFGARKMLTIAGFFLSAGCFMLAASHQYYLAFISRLLMGVGGSFGFVGMLYLSTQWFEAKKFALVVGLSEMIAMIGTGIGQVTLAWVVANQGWRTAIHWSGMFAIVIMVLCYAVVRDKPVNVSEEKSSSQIWANLFETLKQKQVWLAGIYGFFAFSVVNAFTSLWGVPFLVDTYHFSLNRAATMVAMIFVGIAIGAPFNGWVSMRLGQRKPILLVGSSIAALLMTVLFFVPDLKNWEIYFLLLLSGLFSSAYVQCFAISKETTPKKIHGAALALTNMLIMLSAPVLQTFIGLLLHTHFFGVSHALSFTFRLSLGILPLGMAVAFCIALMIKETGCSALE